MAIFGREIHERKERNHKKGVSSTLLSLSLLGKHTYRVRKYRLGLKHILLGRWVGFKKFSHCRKFRLHTHKKQINWELDSKFIWYFGPGTTKIIAPKLDVD